MSRLEYRVVKVMSDGTMIPAGNGKWLPERQIAKKMMGFWKKQYAEWGWVEDLLIDTRRTEEPDNRKPMDSFNGKPVYNWDHVYWEIMEPGSYVDRAIYEHMLNVLPPAYWTRDVLQVGEPYSHKANPEHDNRCEATYSTFVRVTDEVWEYRGHCFRGKTTESGTNIPCAWVSIT